ncbi:hypothetical protein TWF694_004746 [Orbilia ellipsospora]|uniref:DUF7779 domain-containing protein n=1 Tax=Orbilia ellipsospora TaxID=2528407 RepID=A0AAV9WVZ9_9PEZI
MTAPLPVVCSGIQYPVIDLVTIPGLPELLPEYKPRDHSKWISDVFGRRFPSARVMSFRYDFANSRDPSDWSDIINQGWHLLYALVHRRVEEVESQRPIIFVCHSFGGLIVKKALLLAKNEGPAFRKIYESVKGILFLGCPHNERRSEFKECCLRGASVELKTNSEKHPVIESMRSSRRWNIVSEISEKFCEIAPIFPIRSFCENKSTVFRRSSWRPAKSGNLCPEHLCSFGSDNEKVISVDMDHLELSTAFPNRADSFFLVLVEELADLINANCPPKSAAGGSAARPEELDSWCVVDQIGNQTDTTITSPKDELDLSSFPKTPCHVLRPHQPNRGFVGRSDILKNLEEALILNPSINCQRQYAICGLGGMGKTQTALAFAFSERAVNHFKAILLVHATSRASMVKTFSTFAVDLGLIDQVGAGQDAAKELAAHWFSRAVVPWLVIFDNVDSNESRDLLGEFWPQGSWGSVLITSRNKALVSQFGGVELKGLDKSSAVELLLTQTRHAPGDPAENRKAAETIVENIGCLPIAINAAASNIINQVCDLTEFADIQDNTALIAETENIKFFQRSEDPIYEHTLNTVWNSSFQRLTPEESDFMNLLAFMDPDRIPERLLCNGASGSNEPNLAFISTQKKFTNCRAGILRQSLVSHNQLLQEIWIHRMVQASVHSRMTPEKRQEAFDNAVLLLKHTFPVPERHSRHNPKYWPDQERLFTHAQSLCHYYVESRSPDSIFKTQLKGSLDFAELVYNAAWYLYERGIFEPAYPMLDVAEQYCCENKPAGWEAALGDIKGGRASIQTESNQFQEAYANFKEQLQLNEIAFTKGQRTKPSAYEVIALGGVANGLQGLNRYAEAEIYYRKCIDASVGVPGNNALYIVHFGTCLLNQGKLFEAEEAINRVLTGSDLSTPNRRAGTALFALGNIQIGQANELTSRNAARALIDAKWDQAFETHTRAFNIYRAVLGKSHHKVADAYHKMGWHFRQRHNYAAALEHLNIALGIYEKSYLHKNERARAKYAIGCLLQDMGEIKKGQEEIREADLLRRQLLGDKYYPAASEKDFDEIVMFWTR